MKNPFISESTQAFIKEARKTPNYSLLDFLHGYIYGRWIYHYIDIGTGNHPAVKKYLAIKTRFGGKPIDKPATPS